MRCVNHTKLRPTAYAAQSGAIQPTLSNRTAIRFAVVTARDYRPRECLQWVESGHSVYGTHGPENDPAKGASDKRADHDDGGNPDYLFVPAPAKPKEMVG